jgi:Zn-dependent metalloprotease
MRRLGLCGVLFVLVGVSAACSGGDEPPPFESAAPQLASRLATDLGVPVHAYIDGRASHAMVASPTRILAAGDARGETIRAWIAGYSKDLGVDGEALDVRAEGVDALGLHHVVVSSLAKGTRADGAGIDVVTDEAGRFVSFSGHLPPAELGKPRLSEAEAKSRALLDAAEDAPDVTHEIVSIELEVFSANGPVSEPDATLAYRVVTPMLTLWVDAKTGDILAKSANDENVLAFSAEDAFKSPIPASYQRPDKQLDVETYKWDATTYQLASVRTGSRIVAKQFSGYDANGAPRDVGPITSNDPARFDVGYAGYQGKNNSRSHAGVADQIAVDAVHNVALADGFFRKNFGRGPISGNDPVFGDGIDVVVHANFTMRPDASGRLVEYEYRDNAGYDSVTKKISFGDGTMVAAGANASRPEYQMLPTALALDVVGHELTHAFTEGRIGTTGEAGALNEGLADVIGQIFEQSVEKNPRNAATVGERIWNKGQRSGRNLAHPERGLPLNMFTTVKEAGMDKIVHYPNHVTTQLCAKPTSGGKIIREAPNVKNDQGCVHANSLVVSHAWYLMTYGGTNNPQNNSKLVTQVDGMANQENASKIWLASLGMASSKGWVPTATRDFVSLARFQLATTYALFPAEARSVGCAWWAVGVLSDTEMKALGLTCQTFSKAAECWTLDPARGKVSKPDGTYCNAGFESAYYTCLRGQILMGDNCPLDPASTTSLVCAIKNPRTGEAKSVAAGQKPCESAYP